MLTHERYYLFAVEGLLADTVSPVARLVIEPENKEQRFASKNYRGVRNPLELPSKTCRHLDHCICAATEFENPETRQNWDSGYFRSSWVTLGMNRTTTIPSA